MSEAPREVADLRETARLIESEVGRVIVGQETVVRGVVIALLAGGHVLLEGVPGLGKTMLVRTLADVLHLQYSRIQFTPDLMPTDVSGTNVLLEDTHGRREFTFQPGPIFANLVLADEINRATPKTQAALLEAMQEQTVTVSTSVHKLPKPFFVLATQNPIEMEGTYPLPEAELDRFFFKLNVGYPTREQLNEIVRRTTSAAGRASPARRGWADAPVDAGARAAGAHRQPRRGLRGADRDGDPPGRRGRARGRPAATCATAPARAPPRRSCWPPRSWRC